MNKILKIGVVLTFFVLMAFFVVAGSISGSYNLDLSDDKQLKIEGKALEKGQTLDEFVSSKAVEGIDFELREEAEIAFRESVGRILILCESDYSYCNEGQVALDKIK